MQVPADGMAASCVASKCVCKDPKYTYVPAAAWGGTHRPGCYLLPAPHALIDRGYVEASIYFAGISLDEMDTRFKRAVRVTARGIVAAAVGAQDAAKVPLGCSFNQVGVDSSVYVTIKLVLPPLPQWTTELPSIATALDESLAAKIASDAILGGMGAVEVHGVQVATEGAVVMNIYPLVSDTAVESQVPPMGGALPPQAGPMLSLDVTFVVANTDGGFAVVNVSGFAADAVDAVATRRGAVMPLQVGLEQVAAEAFRVTAAPDATWSEEQRRSCDVWDVTVSIAYEGAELARTLGGDGARTAWRNATGPVSVAWRPGTAGCPADSGGVDDMGAVAPLGAAAAVGRPVRGWGRQGSPSVAERSSSESGSGNGVSGTPSLQSSGAEGPSQVSEAEGPSQASGDETPSQSSGGRSLATKLVRSLQRQLLGLACSNESCKTLTG